MVLPTKKVLVSSVSFNLDKRKAKSLAATPLWTLSGDSRLHNEYKNTEEGSSSSLHQSIQESISA